MAGNSQRAGADILGHSYNNASSRLPSVLKPRLPTLNLKMKIVIVSLIALVQLVEGLPTPRILSRHEPQDVARAETGALGRLVYGIISTFCLCALSFALGRFAQPTLNDTTNTRQAFV